MPLLFIEEGSPPRLSSYSDIKELVYALIQLIPPGYVTTYGSIAKILGTSPRLVGKILGENPNPIVVPCHRVVKSDASLGGYSGASGIEFKRKLLEFEGVRFDDKGRVLRDHIITLDMLLEALDKDIKGDRRHG